MVKAIKKLNEMVKAGEFTFDGIFINYEDDNVAMMSRDGNEIIPIPSAGRVKILKTMGEVSSLDIIRAYNENQ